MTFLPALHEADLPLEVVDNLLVRVGVPPFCGEIVLPPGNENPEMLWNLWQQRNLLFGLRQINVPIEAAERDSYPKLLLKVLWIAVDEVVWPLIRLMDQRIVHIQELHTAVPLLERCKMRVVFPKGWCRSSNIRVIGSRVSQVEVADSRGQHHNIARTLKRLQN